MIKKISSYFIFVPLIILLLAGCGQSGRLHLPKATETTSPTLNHVIPPSCNKPNCGSDTLISLPIVEKSSYDKS